MAVPSNPKLSDIKNVK